MMKASHHENRKRDERRPECTSDDVSRRRKLTYIELDLANHTSVRRDLRNHIHEFWHDAPNGHATVLESERVRIVRYCDLQGNAFGQIAGSQTGIGSRPAARGAGEIRLKTLSASHSCPYHSCDANLFIGALFPAQHGSAFQVTPQLHPSPYQ